MMSVTSTKMPHRQTSSRPGPAGGVGNERKADVYGTQEGGSAAEAAGNPLRGAVGELKRQHPHAHDDLGPHHHDSSHHRHEGLPFGRR